MLVELSIPWLIAANVLGCAIVQLALAWGFTRLPVRWFSDRPTEAPLSQIELYEDHFEVRRWKHRLPDGATWFAGGFAKGRLAGTEPAYYRRFLAETRRGERCHWVAIALSPLFLVWNPWWAHLVIVAYFLAANLPCILVQRYNRLRISRTLRRMERGLQSGLSPRSSDGAD